MAHSIMWSANQSHIFSKYPDAFSVRCSIKLPALQESGFIPSVNAGHSLGVKSVPVAPPIRAWTSIPESEPEHMGIYFVHLPQSAALPRLFRFDIPLHQYHTSSAPLRRQNQVLHLDCVDVPFFSDSEHGSRIAIAVNKRERSKLAR